MPSSARCPTVCSPVKMAASVRTFGSEYSPPPLSRAASVQGHSSLLSMCAILTVPHRCVLSLAIASYPFEESKKFQASMHSLPVKRTRHARTAIFKILDPHSKVDSPL